MSIQRAKVNCERCYEIASLTLKAPVGDIYFNSDLYIARNNAMIALEEVIANPNRWVNNMVLGSEKEYEKVATALDKYMGCDYSNPEILGYFKK